MGELPITFVLVGRRQSSLHGGQRRHPRNRRGDVQLVAAAAVEHLHHQVQHLATPAAPSQQQRLENLSAKTFCVNQIPKQLLTKDGTTDIPRQVQITSLALRRCRATHPGVDDPGHGGQLVERVQHRVQLLRRRVLQPRHLRAGLSQRPARARTQLIKLQHGSKQNTEMCPKSRPDKIFGNISKGIWHLGVISSEEWPINPIFNPILIYFAGPGGKNIHISVAS